MKWLIVSFLLGRLLLQASVHLHQLYWLHWQLPSTPAAAIQRHPPLAFIVSGLGMEEWQRAKDRFHRESIGGLWMCLSLDLSLIVFTATPLLRLGWEWSAPKRPGRFINQETVYGASSVIQWLLGLALRDCIGALLVGQGRTTAWWPILGRLATQLAILPLLTIVGILLLSNNNRKVVRSWIFLSLALLASAGLWLAAVFGPAAQRQGWIFGDCRPIGKDDLPGWPTNLRPISGILKCPTTNPHLAFAQGSWGIFPGAHSKFTTISYYKASDHHPSLVADEWIIAGLVHEVGHLTRMHGLLVVVLLNQGGILLASWLVWWLLQPSQQRRLLGAFFPKEDQRMMIGPRIVLLSLVLGLVYSLGWKPWVHLIRWMIELDADRFALRAGFGEDLIDLLAAHQYYSGQFGMGSVWRTFWMSDHPTALMRIARLMPYN